MVKYRLTERAQEIVDETTPNPEWDEHGHLFFVLEWHLGFGEYALSVAELVEEMKSYNQLNEARMPADEASVRRGIEWLVQVGIAELVTN
jgi:hypothetical protein